MLRRSNAGAGVIYDQYGMYVIWDQGCLVHFCCTSTCFENDLQNVLQMQLAFCVAVAEHISLGVFDS